MSYTRIRRRPRSIALGSRTARGNRGGGGGGRIRTYVGIRRQIYSLLPLTTRPPLQTVKSSSLSRSWWLRVALPGRTLVIVWGAVIALVTQIVQRRRGPPDRAAPYKPPATGRKSTLLAGHSRSRGCISDGYGSYGESAYRTRERAGPIAAQPKAPASRNAAISFGPSPSTSRNTASVSPPRAGAGPVARPKLARHGRPGSTPSPCFSQKPRASRCGLSTRSREVGERGGRDAGPDQFGGGRFRPKRPRPDSERLVDLALPLARVRPARARQAGPVPAPTRRAPAIARRRSRQCRSNRHCRRSDRRHAAHGVPNGCRPDRAVAELGLSSGSAMVHNIASSIEKSIRATILFGRTGRAATARRR